MFSNHIFNPYTVVTAEVT